MEKNQVATDTKKLLGYISASNGEFAVYSTGHRYWFEFEPVRIGLEGSLVSNGTPFLRHSNQLRRGWQKMVKAVPMPAHGTTPTPKTTHGKKTGLSIVAILVVATLALLFTLALCGAFYKIVTAPPPTPDPRVEEIKSAPTHTVAGDAYIGTPAWFGSRDPYDINVYGEPDLYLPDFAPCQFTHKAYDSGYWLRGDCVRGTSVWNVWVPEPYVIDLRD